MAALLPGRLNDANFRRFGRWREAVCETFGSPYPDAVSSPCGVCSWGPGLMARLKSARVAVTLIRLVGLAVTVGLRRQEAAIFGVTGEAGGLGSLSMYDFI